MAGLRPPGAWPSQERWDPLLRTREDYDRAIAAEAETQRLESIDPRTGQPYLQHPNEPIYPFIEGMTGVSTQPGLLASPEEQQRWWRLWQVLQQGRR